MDEGTSLDRGSAAVSAAWRLNGRRNLAGSRLGRGFSRMAAELTKEQPAAGAPSLIQPWAG
jgi:hypothetical protein